MSLVAYSDDSEEEDRKDDNIAKHVKSGVPFHSMPSPDSTSSIPIENQESVPMVSVVQAECTGDKLDDVSNVNAKNNIDKKPDLFSSLPSPTKMSSDMLDFERCEVKDCAVSTRKSTVKITIPSLLQFQEDENELPSKKLKTTVKGSRLFSILPPPKAVPVKEAKRPLVPNVLTKRKSPSDLKVKLPLEVKHQKLPADKRSHMDYPDSGEESGGEGSCAKSKDFFSLANNDDNECNLQDKANYLSASGISSENDSTSRGMIPNDISSSSELFEPPTQWTTFLPSTPCVGQVPQTESTGSFPAESIPSSSAQLSCTEGSLEIDEETLKRLGGPKYKRQMQDMEFIDISEDTIMPDSNEWLTKQLTVEKNPNIRSHSHRKNDGPTTQQRRKHQITYLAFQAKEKELELKNQWSQNRMSRKQTQSKYGF